VLRRVWEELDYRFDIAASHVGLTSSASKVWKYLWEFSPQSSPYVQ
jgi:hypothetical protein